MAENVKVIVRCRPMNKTEISLNCQCSVKVDNCVVETWDPNDGPAFAKQFTFDSAYGQDSTTEAIYNDICYPLVESVLEGYNATIFVYGQTGCGKSFTMEGVKADNSPQKGVISRAFEHIFEAISVTSGVKYLALVSYLEIYNEQIRDLLLPSDKAPTPLHLKESPNEGVTVPGLSVLPVQNAVDCERLLNIGSKSRMIGATLMNQNSSRSHSIFSISVEHLSNINSYDNIKKGKLNLVDLAGSERQTKTGATGERLKEATKINLSLSALGNVISALVDGKAKHIPYRDSKLTRLLQDSLGGNTRTLMIACIGPASKDYMETLSTLRYANRAKNIHNKPKVNEDPKDAILRQYQEEINRLKYLLEHKQIHKNDIEIEDLTATPSEEINQNVSYKYADSELDVKRDKLLLQYQQEMVKLKSLHENEKIEKENVLKEIQKIKQEYDETIKQLNMEINSKKKQETSELEILERIKVLKASIIGGEKADDRELSERRKRKKQAAEERASVVAHLLAKIEMNEDRELLHNQYKDISYELKIKSGLLRKYRHKIKMLEKDIVDIQSEFETERQDYLETIRKQERSNKLLNQVAEKLVGTLKKECNYSDLESIKEQAIWLEDAQKYKLPDLVILRTKLPPPDHNNNGISSSESGTSSPYINYDEKMNDTDRDIISSYFQPTTKRVSELLKQSDKLDPARVIQTWREFARRNKSTEESDRRHSPKKINLLDSTNNGSKNPWQSGAASNHLNELNLKKPFRLEALPNIVKSDREIVNKMEFL